MGTHYTYGTGHLTPIEFLRREIQSEKHKIVAHSIQGSVAYLACEYTADNGKRRVYGLVCLLFKDGDTRGYKPVDEDMGPCECDCPKRILDMLSPTDSENALEWRERCRQRLASKSRRAKVGQSIRFDAPLKFSDGSAESEFTVTKHLHRGRSITAYRGKNGRLYKIRGISKMKYSVVS